MRFGCFVLRERQRAVPRPVEVPARELQLGWMVDVDVDVDADGG